MKIKKSELVHGHYYHGRCRNASIARWNGEEEVFYHYRVKYGNRFIENIHCPEDETYYDVFVADKDITGDLNLLDGHVINFPTETRK